MHEPWAFLCEIGFIGWLLAVSGFILHSFPSRDVFVKKAAVVWGGGFLFFYAIWVAAMLKA